MKNKRFTLGRLTLLVLLVAFLALAACQNEAQLDEAVATLEATVQPVDTEEPTLEATEIPPTPEPTPVPPTPTPTAEPVAAYEPVFEPVDCWWTLPDSQPVDCGYLVVPENRSDPDSPDIRIATAILRHPGGNPEPDPIVNVHGGPGGGSLKVFDLAYSEFTSFFETNRDVIVFDQRGVGLSEPELDCPELKAAMNDLFDHTLGGQQLTDSEVQDHLLGLAVECGDAFSQTIDLSAYDSANSAADINDLRIALGYEQINLYAESYGPRVAQSTMRDFPDGLRSVVLDAPMSTNSPFDNEAKEFGNALNQLFEACAADEACNMAFPDLRTVWIDTLSQLDENPVPLSVTNPLTGETFDILLDDGVLSTALWRFSYSTSNVPVMPALIYAVSQGDYAPAVDAFSRFLIPLSVISVGDFYNVGCRERDPISSIENFDALLDEYPETRAFWEENFLESRNQLFSPSLCQSWGGGGIAESEYEPVMSSIPTILTVGNHDPSADVEETALIAETLDNSFGPYVYDGMAHVVYGNAECPTGMINAFIIDPTTEPDPSCMADMSLTFRIPGEASEIAWEPFTNEDMGYTTLIPTGWEELIPGAYSRGNPAIDPTLLAQLSSPNETAEDFLGQILANLGVAALPETPVRVMDSNGLSWSVYLVAGDPTTAVALAESETTTYMVVLKAAGDEFDALADGLLVPAIMAFTPIE